MEQREGYKKTKIGWIPEDWDLRALGDSQLSEKITQGPNPKYNIGEPSTSYRALKTKDLYDYGIKYLTADKISPETFQGCEASELKDKDILVAIVGRGSIGKSNMFREQAGIRYLYTRAIGLVRVKQTTIQPEFINQYFQSPKAKTYFDRGIGGSTGQEVLQTSTLKAMPFPVPELPEQKKIASILTTVDDKISSIDQQIQQTEQLKKGLMEKLLTEGIGHTEFKETKIGWIPKGWGVVKINKIIELMTDYVANGSFQSLRENVHVVDEQDYALYVRLVDLRAGLGHSGQKYVNQSSYEFLNKSNLFGNEILMANIGANVGEVFLMPKMDKPATIAPNMIVVKPDSDKVFHQYFFYYLKSRFGLRELDKVISGSGHPKINKTELKTVNIICPPLDEQKQIATILSTVDDKIEVLTQKKAHYQTLKKGLSQQLLTGQMRVKI